MGILFAMKTLIIAERVAEALWIADEPWRACGGAYADADVLDKDMYRQKAWAVIDHLRLTEETALFDVGDRIRFVSKWWDEP